MTTRITLLGEEMLVLADWFHGHDFDLVVSHDSGIGAVTIAKCRECEKEINITCFDRW
jgi:hypothetical protein